MKFFKKKFVKNIISFACIIASLYFFATGSWVVGIILLVPGFIFIQGDWRP